MLLAYTHCDVSNDDKDSKKVPYPGRTIVPLCSLKMSALTTYGHFLSYFEWVQHKKQRILQVASGLKN